MLKTANPTLQKEMATFSIEENLLPMATHNQLHDFSVSTPKLKLGVASGPISLKRISL